MGTVISCIEPEMALSITNFMFYIFYPVKIILGVAVFLANFLIFLIFVSKPKLTPSDYLIIPNLLVDTLQGIIMCFPYFLFGEEYMFDASFISEIFTFFSLVMLILMSVNRYVAVALPRKYKRWFCMRNILISFSSIFILTLAIFSILIYF